MVVEKSVNRKKGVGQRIKINEWQTYLTPTHVIGCLLLIFLPSFVLAKSTSDSNLGQSEIVKHIAILPFENLSENSTAARTLGEFLKKELSAKGWLNIKEGDIVEEFLAKRRIRYTGGITKVMAKEMGKTLGVDAVMVGSINQFSDLGDKVNVGVTVRLIGTNDGKMIWADTLSYTGHDFVGLLGLGYVASADVLGSRVVTDLIKEISDKSFMLNETGLSPFEIERIEVLPSVTREETKIWMRIKVLSITEEPEEIKTIVDNVETRFEKGKVDGYEGYIIAPSAEGIHPIAVVVVDKAGMLYTFDAVGKIIIDNTPPKIDVTVNRKIFAPQKKGFVLLSPKLMSIDEIDEWIIEFFDKEGNKVRSDRGYGKLPKGLIWRGETDKFGRVEDGEYAYKFSVKDVAGNETIVTDSVRVKNNPPDIKINGNKVEDKVLFTFENTPYENIKSWKLSILDKEGKILQTFEGEGELPQKIEYLLEQGADINKMSFSVAVVDEVDNIFSLTKSIPSLLSRKAPLMKSNGNGNGNGKGKGHLAEDF